MNAALVKEIYEPGSLQEAIRILKDKGREAAVIAGGTDLVIELKEQVDKPSILVDILKLPLSFIEGSRAGGMRIGATTTAKQVAASSLLKKELPVLVDAAIHLGGPQTQEMATVGGNLCNGSPCANFTNVLVALEASVTLEEEEGKREVELKDFYLGPGATGLKPGEILTTVTIPPIAGAYGASYVKHCLRKEMDIAIVGAAVLLQPDGNRIRKIRIALGSVGPTTLVARNAQEVIEGKAYSAGLAEEAGNAAAERDASYIDDVRSSASYRRTVTPVVVRRAIEQAWAMAKGGKA
jgi:CO/xanthine dehydrogenase FAD-binding subunit